MRIGALVFARLSSSRLPRKALADIAGRSLIGRVLDRTRSIGLDGPIVLATSNSASDDDMAELARQENVACFRGDLNDVAARAVAAAKSAGFDAFARICGDRPFFDPELVAKLANDLRESKLDLATNCIGATFPPGMAAEIVSTATLERMLPEMTIPGDREHVTPIFYRSLDRLRIASVVAPDWFAKGVSFAVDTSDDLDRARFIAGRTDRSDGIPASQKSVHAAALDWVKARTELRP